MATISRWLMSTVTIGLLLIRVPAAIGASIARVAFGIVSGRTFATSPPPLGRACLGRGMVRHVAGQYSGCQAINQGPRWHLGTLPKGGGLMAALWGYSRAPP